MTNKNEIPDINKKLVEMDDGEVAEGSPDFAPAGNEVAAEDLSSGMGEKGQTDDKRFLVKEKTPRVH